MIATPSQTVGPYFALGLGSRTSDELVEPGTPGAIGIVGRVLDGAGQPVPDAMVEVWQADTSGEHVEGFGWGRSVCDEQGRFSFVTVKPGAVEDVAVGRQAPHLNLLVFARGLLKPTRTRLYFPDEDAANEIDPVLFALPDDRARATLLAEPEGEGLRFDIRLQGDAQTVFFAL